MGLSHPISSKYIHRYGSLHYKVGAAAMQGFRPEMEDAETIKLSLPKHPDTAFFGVFDGHNGSAASMWASKNVYHYIDRLENFTEESIKKALLEADTDFLKSDVKHHGSTAVFAIVTRHNALTGSTEINNNNSNNNSTSDQSNLKGSTGVEKKKYKFRAIIGNIGDSRALIGRKNGTTTEALTKDHKPSNEEELSRIRAAGGFVDYGRVDGQLALSRALGDSSYKDNKNLSQDKQRVIALPDITIAEDLDEDDFLILCCDGIFEVFSNEDTVNFVAEQLKKTDDLSLIAANLLEQVLRKGSKDNMTAIIVQFKNGMEFHKETGEFLPGPYHAYKFDRGFAEAYGKNCRMYGYSLDEALTILEKQTPSSASSSPISIKKSSSSSVIIFDNSGSGSEKSKDQDSSSSSSSSSENNTRETEKAPALPLDSSPPPSPATPAKNKNADGNTNNNDNDGDKMNTD